jgi:hypothetical protein
MLTLNCWVKELWNKLFMDIQRLQWVSFLLQSVAHYMWLICGKMKKRSLAPGDS